jgi:hypothetical protein
VSTSASANGTAADRGADADTAMRTGAGVDASGEASSPRTRTSTGIDVRRDSEIGAALTASGWALHHWTPNRG